MKLYYKLMNFIHKVKKFIYYGKAGLRCFDFDAHGVYTMAEAHLNRVHSFMNSDKTHLVWNSSKDSKLMRRLTEAKHLANYLSDENSCRNIKRFSKICEMERGFPENKGKLMFDRGYKKAPRSMINAALKLDQAEFTDRRKRFFKLIEKYNDHWWD